MCAKSPPLSTTGASALAMTAAVAPGLTGSVARCRRKAPPRSAGQAEHDG
jgi:hypothetical protein